MAKNNINVRVTFNGGEIIVRDDEMNRFELTIPSGIECRVQGDLKKDHTKEDLKNTLMDVASEFIDKLTGAPTPEMYAPAQATPVATVPPITVADLNAAISSGVKSAIFEVLKGMGISMEDIKACNETKKEFEAQKESEPAPIREKKSK